MGKQYFYEFSGRVFINAENQNQAEQLATGVPPVGFLIDEDIYEIDEHYIPIDLKKRDEKNHTHLHPLEDSEECKHGYTLKKFL